MLNMRYQIVLLLGTLFHFVKAEDYCDKDCEDYEKEVEEYEKCKDAKSNCGMSTLALSMNVILGILTIIGIIAICIRLSLCAKILERKKPKHRASKSEMETFEDTI